MTQDKSGAIVTMGVQSVVNTEDGQPGHITMVDCDGGYTLSQFVRAMDHFDGFTVIFESSPGSYHGYNMTVGGAEAIALQKLRMVVDDHQHTAIGYRRANTEGWDAGGWTLRLGEKLRPDADGGGVYKTKPFLVDCWWNPTDTPQSRPHIELLSKLYPSIEAPEDANLFGKTVYTLTYQTLDDKTKEMIRNGR